MCGTVCDCKALQRKMKLDLDAQVQDKLKRRDEVQGEPSEIVRSWRCWMLRRPNFGWKRSLCQDYFICIIYNIYIYNFLFKSIAGLTFHQALEEEKRHYENTLLELVVPWDMKMTEADGSQTEVVSFDMFWWFLMSLGTLAATREGEGRGASSASLEGKGGAKSSWCHFHPLPSTSAFAPAYPWLLQDRDEQLRYEKHLKDQEEQRRKDEEIQLVDKTLGLFESKLMKRSSLPSRNIINL